MMGWFSQAVIFGVILFIAGVGIPLMAALNAGLGVRVLGELLIITRKRSFRQPCSCSHHSLSDCNGLFQTPVAA